MPGAILALALVTGFVIGWPAVTPARAQILEGGTV
jgi:hypothetical protein